MTFCRTTIFGASLTVISLAFSPEDGSEHFNLDPSETSSKWGRYAGWAMKKCGPRLSGLDNLFVGNFLHGNKWVTGLGVRRQTPAGTVFLCVPEDCWFGLSKLPERYQRLLEGESACRDPQGLQVRSL